MKSEEIRRLYALATAVGGLLQVRYSGDVLVSEVEPPDATSLLGYVWLAQTLDYLGAADPEGEGWEYSSSKAGASLRAPLILLDDGTELTIEQAEGIAQAKLSEQMKES
jgi:hypothetical protein